MISWHSACGQLGQYRLLHPIGHGGTAVVHLAEAPGGQMVAIKMLPPPSARNVENRRRLAREVSAMRRIRSPFVAEVIDADVTGAIPYVVTRLVQGPTLADVIATGGPLGGADLQRVARGLAEGLAAVHAAGIVHRDLKPGNVMIAGGDPVLIDFGIAYQAGDNPLTHTGTFIGTPGHLAPEVINGQRAQPPADVHAWGTTVGYAARGEPLFGTGSYEQVFCRILRGEARLDGIHQALYPLIAAALLREPGQRPSAAWLASEVARIDLTAPAPVQGSITTVLTRETLPLPLALGCSDDRPRPIAGQRPEDFADLLPAIRTAPSLRPTPKARAAGLPRPHPLLALTALAVAVGISYFLPVAGTVAVAALVTLLRAGDKARCGLAGRRDVRGRRPWDCLLIVSSAPWALARSVAETVVLAPALLAAAGVIVTAATIWFHAADVLPDWAAVAALYTALGCLGPRSRPVRREMNRILGCVASTPLGAVVALLTATVVAMSVAVLVLMQAPPTWPLPAPPSMVVHVPGFNLAKFRG